MSEPHNSAAIRRSLDRLGDPARAKCALEIVAKIFDYRWLGQKEGSHLLQKLWLRQDRISTVELYTLGCALLRLEKEGCHQWLKNIVRDIKKARSPHGLISEIIAFGMISIENCALQPAQRGNPGYDFRYHSSLGMNYYIAVKNHDITDSAKSFNRNSKLIRKRWRERLLLERCNLGLFVFAKDPLNEEDFEAIRRAALHDLPMIPGSHLSVRPYLDVFIGYPPEFDGVFSKSHVSDIVVISAPAPPAENRRFIKNIRDASDKFRKNVDRADNALNVVSMRVHVNADIDHLTQLAKAMIDEGEMAFDSIMFHQPAYVRNKSGESLLNYTSRILVNERFIQKTVEQKHSVIKISPPIGGVSVDRPNLNLFTGENQAFELPQSSYVFQQGDLYVEGFMQNGSAIGQLRSPAFGVRQHMIASIGNKQLSIMSKVFAENDDLLIV